MRIIIKGTVQGVGFRPTVHRIATSMHLHGFVQNNGSDVLIAVDAKGDELIERLKVELPPLARMDSIQTVNNMPEDLGDSFHIAPSSGGGHGVGIPNDTAICSDCLHDLFDPRNRRYLYPFVSCTNCGERFTVLEGLPYDRAKTSMDDFKLCDQCEEEYRDPADRRFHHQTISCRECGPRYYMINGNKKVSVDRSDRRVRGRFTRWRDRYSKELGRHAYMLYVSNVAKAEEMVRAAAEALCDNGKEPGGRETLLRTHDL